MRRRPPETIDAGLIALHRRCVSDVPDLLSAIETSIVELSGFLSWAGAGAPSFEALEGAVAAIDADFDAGRGFEYVLREAATGDLVGEAGGEFRERGAVVEIGYWVATGRTGRGFASAA